MRSDNPQYGYIPPRQLDYEYLEAIIEDDISTIGDEDMLLQEVEYILAEVLSDIEYDNIESPPPQRRRLNSYDDEDLTQRYPSPTYE